MNRYYQLGLVPWSMGVSVPEALFVPPPNISQAVHPHHQRAVPRGLSEAADAPSGTPADWHPHVERGRGEDGGVAVRPGG
eukprot:8200935-Lingulodinium_polyedra.AAC.1